MLDVIVTQKNHEALGIASFELSAANGAPLPAFTAGAHIDVQIADGIVRQYSLCNHPEERHRYLIAVLNEPTSRGGSKALHERIEVGQTLRIGEPRNLFALEPDADHYLLFAAGIGITPILAMAYTLAQAGRSFELHYCSREPERAAFLAELRGSPFASRVISHFDSGADGQKLQAGEVLKAPAPGHHLYVCGPGGFIDFILNSAYTCGWLPAQVHREYFAAPQVAHEPDQAFEVELAHCGRVFQIPLGRSVLEVLDEAGVELQSSCEQGICGACVTRVLAGVPDHRDQFLSVAEQARNDQFTPCCSRAKSPRLVLDL